MAVFELAGLANLQRLSLVRVQKLTDNAVFFLAEHAKGLERLHLSYCDRLSLPAVQLLLRKLVNLQHLTATGIPAFKRKGIKRFSDPPPSVNITFSVISDCHIFEINLTLLFWGVYVLLHRHMIPTSKLRFVCSVVRISVRYGHSWKRRSSGGERQRGKT